MKTVTFSNDQARAVRYALKDRIGTLQTLLASSVEPSEQMWTRDQLDVARQALALMEA